MIVADATLLVHLALPVAADADAATARAVYRRDSDWRVPGLWASEVRHVALKYVRSGQLALDDAVVALDKLTDLFVLNEEPVAHRSVLRTAVDLNLSGYDAEYAALAAKLGATLVTSDLRLLASVPGASSPTAFIVG